MSLWIRDARVVDGSGAAAFRAHVRVDGGAITDISTASAPPAASADEVIDAAGRVLIPGFVDAHTHALFAGDRLDEFERKLAGATYLEILAAGGGILSTVRALRATPDEQLTALLSERLRRMLREGTTSLEVKSGYGLDTRNELRMLRAIQKSARDFPGTVVATALLGHALDPAEPGFIDHVVHDTLPAVHAEFPGIAVDAFCEHGAWPLDACRRLLSSARDLGHPLRLHTDQFHALGGLQLGLELGARSLDHLEAATPEGLSRLAQSGAFGVMLPVTGFHTDQRFAAGRSFLDQGGQLVLASNYNPGSAPSASMPFVIALGVRQLGLSVLEAIRATTSTPAALLGLVDRGQVRVGARADLLLLCHRDERLLGYELGGNPVEHVWVSGTQII